MNHYISKLKKHRTEICSVQQLQGKIQVGQFLKISSTHQKWPFEPQRLAKTKGSRHKWRGHKLVMFRGYKLNVTELLISFRPLWSQCRAQVNQTQNCNFKLPTSSFQNLLFLLHCPAPGVWIHTTGLFYKLTGVEESWNSSVLTSLQQGWLYHRIFNKASQGFPFLAAQSPEYFILDLSIILKYIIWGCMYSHTHRVNPSP